MGYLKDSPKVQSDEVRITQSAAEKVYFQLNTDYLSLKVYPSSRTTFLYNVVYEDAAHAMEVNPWQF